MPARCGFGLCVIATVLQFVSAGCNRASSRGQVGQTSGIAITKQPVAFATRTFDPLNPPSDMPPLGEGEEAECDSNFLSSANVGGEVRQTDAGHAWVTVSRISVTLQLSITIWAPVNANSRVLEHEEGHRQISEHYYQTAGELAQRIAANYIGQKTEITGTDFAGESSQLFQRIASEITDEFNKQLNPEPAQLLYDGITDHGRNQTSVQDAVASAIKNTQMQTPLPVPTPGN